MCPALQPLKRRHDFLRVAAARRKWAMPGLILQTCARAGDGDAGGGSVRVGYTASRKVGNAVARNRVKRRLRAVAADILADMGRVDTDYVLIGRRATVDRSYDDLLDDLETAVYELERRAKRAAQGKRK